MKPPVPIKPGVVFWPSGLTDDKTHPWFVISVIVEGRVLCVNATDFDHYSESTCVLDVSDHECITKKSSIYYSQYERFDARKLALELAKSTLLMHKPDLRSDVLAKIIEGAKSTKDMTDAIKIKYGLIKPKSDVIRPY